MGMCELRPDAEAVHVLHPGDVAVAQRGERLETLLGSCIAIILTDPHRTLGAMCHVVHSGSARASLATDTCHAQDALDCMFALLRQHAIDPIQCDAYVFGGGNMFPALFERGHVGEKNVEWALQALSRLHIRIRGLDVEGTAYRRVRWTVGPGEPELVAVGV